MRALFGKELIVIFRQPLIYILAAVYSLVTGIVFYSLLANYITNIQDQVIQQESATRLQLITAQLIFPLMGNLNFLMMVLAPAVTMGAMSDEFRFHTFSLLRHSNRSPWTFIFFKFLSHWAGLIFILSTVSIFPLLLWYAGIYEYSFLWTGILAIILNLGLFVAMGLWCSTMTNQPILAMFMTYVLILLHWMVSWIKELTSNIWWMNFWDYISVPRHFEWIAKGEVPASTLGFYLIHILFFLFLARLAWQKREWK